MENSFLVSISILTFLAIAIPLIYSLYLYVARFSLSFVNKHILNYGSGICSSISLLSFIILYILIILHDQSVSFGFDFINLQKFSLNFGIHIDKFNILFLIIASSLSVFVGFFSKKYFDKKKQFVFTKQRYFAFLSLTSFLVYLFFISLNLIQSIIISTLLSSVVFFFSYFDIFKNPANHNIVRFYRIDLVGNIFLLLASLILFKYSVLSQGYIESNSLDYNELNVLISYMYGICSSFEFEVMTLCFLIAVLSKLTIFPFSCYWGFYANSSNVFYLTSFSLVNNLIGLYILLKCLPVFKMFGEYQGYFFIFLGICFLFSLLQLLFERNIKIIFGYINSILSIAFVIFALFFEQNIVVVTYSIALFVMVLALSIFFILDRNNFKNRIINKQVGFLLERAHIYIFENLPCKINKIFNFIDEKIVHNIIIGLIATFDFVASLIVLKTSRKSEVKCIRNILLIFALCALFAVFLALFGRYKC